MLQIKLENFNNIKPYQRLRIFEASHAESFQSAMTLLNKTRGLSVYKGGNHIAVHYGKKGSIVDPKRIAIITEIQ